MQIGNGLLKLPRKCFGNLTCRAALSKGTLQMLESILMPLRVTIFSRETKTLYTPFLSPTLPCSPRGYYRRRKIKDRRGVDDTPTFHTTARPITLYTADT